MTFFSKALYQKNHCRPTACASIILLADTPWLLAAVHSAVQVLLLQLPAAAAAAAVSIELPQLLHLGSTGTKHHML
jgi:hypothetical protein